MGTIVVTSSATEVTDCPLQAVAQASTPPPYFVGTLSSTCRRPHCLTRSGRHCVSPAARGSVLAPAHQLQRLELTEDDVQPRARVLETLKSRLFTTSHLLITSRDVI